jgi:hypothetical protein
VTLVRSLYCLLHWQRLVFSYRVGSKPELHIDAGLTYSRNQRTLDDIAANDLNIPR